MVLLWIKVFRNVKPCCVVNSYQANLLGLFDPKN